MSADRNSASISAPQRPRGLGSKIVVNYLLPFAVFLAAIVFWEWRVWYKDIPPYILPAPSLILATLAKDWGTLSQSLLVTLTITFEGLFVAVLGGVGLALLFAQ